MLFYSIKYLPLVIVALVANTIPLFTALMGYYFLHERLNATEKACLVLSFVGVAILVVANKDSSGTET